MDVQANELGVDLGITGYPTLYLWTEGTTVDKPIEFKSLRTVEEL